MLDIRAVEYWEDRVFSQAKDDIEKELSRFWEEKVKTEISIFRVWDYEESSDEFKEGARLACLKLDKEPGVTVSYQGRWVRSGKLYSLYVVVSRG